MYLFCLEVIANYPLRRRPRKIAKNLLMDTLSKTSAWFKGEVTRRRREREWMEKGERAVEAEAGTEQDIAPPLLEAMEESVLDRLVSLRVITQEEADLIHRTRLLGTPLRSLSRGKGRQAYDRLTKRRQRAEAKIRGFFERFRKQQARALGLDPREVSFPEVIELLKGHQPERSG